MGRLFSWRAHGYILIQLGRVVADGRELATFGHGGCRVELSFPAVESESVTVEIGDCDASAKCQLLSEIEVY